MIYTEYDPLQSVIVGDTYAPGDVDHLLTKGNTSQFNKILEEKQLTHFIKIYLRLKN